MSESRAATPARAAADNRNSSSSKYFPLTPIQAREVVDLDSKAVSTETAFLTSKRDLAKCYYGARVPSLVRRATESRPPFVYRASMVPTNLPF